MVESYTYHFPSSVDMAAVSSVYSPIVRTYWGEALDTMIERCLVVVRAKANNLLVVGLMASGNQKSPVLVFGVESSTIAVALDRHIRKGMNCNLELDSCDTWALVEAFRTCSVEYHTLDTHRALAIVCLHCIMVDRQQLSSVVRVVVVPSCLGLTAAYHSS